MSADSLTHAHIAAEARLRSATVAATTRLWKNLPGYDRADVPVWLARVLPVVLTAQRQSVSLTEAYLAQKLQRRPFGLDPNLLIGSGVRAGVAPEEVYQRPFVTLWADLKAGKGFAVASEAALARIRGSAAMDVQLSMARTAQAVGIADARIQRFQRVADGGACDFCQEVDGAILNSDDAMPLHNFCGCGIEPLTDAPPVSALPSTVAVHDHGELGPVLADPNHSFTQL